MIHCPPFRSEGYWKLILDTRSPVERREYAPLRPGNTYDSGKIDLMVANHAEVDHSGGLQAVMRYAPEATVIVSKRGRKSEGTRKMAEAIGNDLGGEGIPYKLFHMAISDRNDVIAEIFKTKALIIRSPTLNNGLLPTISPILEDIKGLNFRIRLALLSAVMVGSQSLSSLKKNIFIAAKSRLWRMA